MTRALATPSIDLRAQPRFSLVARFTAVSSCNFYAGWTENVSDGGVFVGMSQPPPIGERVALEIMSEGAKLSAWGEVRWHRADEDGELTGCGVRFVDMDAELEAGLQEMLSRSGQPPLFVE